MSTNTAGRRGKDDDVLELVHSVMHRYRARQYRFLRDGPQAITHMEGKVLFFFERHPGATQSDLAQHSGRDKAQLARLIKGLRDKGLLDAEADETDRRQVRLRISETGLTVQRELKRQARQVSLQALAGLSAEEQSQLTELLKRVQANLGEE
jgi:DNA-binding MarR family transcriptional regulator